mmetsp:Transcript_10500/g.24019  ORF Transcript_10500/g.24019 Transcript_10500/m.24019 type:complete len:248 (-) Transcript_10500:909-1652(-)
MRLGRRCARRRTRRTTSCSISSPRPRGQAACVLRSGTSVRDGSSWTTSFLPAPGLRRKNSFMWSRRLETSDGASRSLRWSRRWSLASRTSPATSPSPACCSSSPSMVEDPLTTGPSTTSRSLPRAESRATLELSAGVLRAIAQCWQMCARHSTASSSSQLELRIRRTWGNLSTTSSRPSTRSSPAEVQLKEGRRLQSMERASSTSATPPTPPCASLGSESAMPRSCPTRGFCAPRSRTRPMQDMRKF